MCYMAVVVRRGRGSEPLLSLLDFPFLKVADENHQMYQSLPGRKPETTEMLPAGRADVKDVGRPADAQGREK